MNTTIYIITSFYNDLNNTKRLLNSLEKQQYKDSKTIVIDDSPSKSISTTISELFPTIELIKGSGNLWWTGAIHLGIEKVLTQAKEGDFILTINNDCKVDSNYLTQIIHTSLKNNRAIVGSLVIDQNNPEKVIDAGVRINWTKGEFISLKKSKDKDIQKNIDTLTTKGTLYPVEVFKKVGNFDKKHFPHYLSDYEFACRAKDAGFKLMIDYKAIVYNDPQRTGFGESIKADDLKLKNLIKVLFTKKSKVNLKDQFNFIKLCAPKKYRFKNYLILFKKIIQRFVRTM